jgi:hypothetical protein
MKKMRILIILVILTFTNAGISQNLIDDSSWSVGTGNVPGFFKFGPDNKNIREVGVNPFGASTVLWQAVPDGTSIQDGGWDSKYYTVDPSKSFRFSVWIKKSNSNDGNTLFGFHALNTSEAGTSRKLDGTPQNSPYFFWGDLPQLDTWYLLVGYAHGHGHTGLNHQGGIYDTSGVKVATLTDFKLDTTTYWLVHRTYLYNDANTADEQFFYGPTLYELNGNEPTIQEMINPNVGTTSGLWTKNGADIYFDSGNVAIGRTTVASGYALVVDGNIRTREVRVDTESWPDYVFSEDYDLLTLDEIKKHIEEKGHLPNIPSAKEVAENGIQLGEMNRLLLEKIEEQMLYIFQLEQRINELENQKDKNKRP